jgi:condensin complex subunit 1
MLALAKREVVTERVDSLLKIGLGHLGTNDLVLARYSCIALQRLGGSAKKVKGEFFFSLYVRLTPGSLQDKTVRLPMDNPVFVKLEAILKTSHRSPQWYVVLTISY